MVNNWKTNEKCIISWIPYSATKDYLNLTMKVPTPPRGTRGVRGGYEGGTRGARGV